MSIPRPRELSLSELIEESNLIVVVDFLGGYVEEVSLTRTNSITPSPDTLPAFQKKGNIFKVTETLKNSGKIKVPEQIKIPDENWRKLLSKHKEKYLNTPAKLYSMPEYKSKVKSISKAVVLFLHHFQDTYELTARKAYEDKDGLEKVMMLLNPA